MPIQKFRGLESNQRPPGSEPGVTTGSNCPGSNLFLQLGEKELNLHLLVQSQAAYRLADPRECPVGVEPTCSAWKTDAFAARPRAQKAEGEGVEPSRLIARPFSGRLPSPIGLSFRFKLRRQESNLQSSP